ncbi:MAG: SPOR domain-containing protein [Alphaproteobacteria bacterium]|nr:MAG: SPOR domain-containing protein [Alphaproteobacteria bacterium]
MPQSKWNKKGQHHGIFAWLSFDTPKTYGLVFFLALLVIWGSWQAWNYDVGPYEIVLEAPLVRAEPGPYRMRPANYGEVKVPHADKVIFDVMQDNADEITQVKTRPGYEEPLSLEKPVEVPEVVQDPFMTKKEVGDVANAGDNILAANKQSDGVEESADTSSAPGKGDPLIGLVDTKGPPKLVSEPGSVNPPTRADIAKKGEYWVRLATTQTYDGALSEWNRLSSRFEEELEGKEGTVAMIDMESGKKLYPLYVGPYDSMERARKTCAKIRDRLGCMTEQLKPR